MSASTDVHIAHTCTSMDAYNEIENLCTGQRPISLVTMLTYSSVMVLPTCHVMVSMALTNQRRPRKGWKTPYTPDGVLNAFTARLKEGRKCVSALF